MFPVYLVFRMILHIRITFIILMSQLPNVGVPVLWETNIVLRPASPCRPAAVTEFVRCAGRRRQLRVQRELEDATREVVVVAPESSRVAACIEAALPTRSIASYVSTE